MWIFRKLYNYTTLGFKCYQCYSSFCKSGDYDDSLMDELVDSIYSCGSVCIKLCQWFIPTLEFMHIEQHQLVDLTYEKPLWLRNLYRVYEHCPEHSLRYSYSEYERMFHKSFTQDYRIISCVGSGSIGQVYKIQSIHTETYYAMKIIHPHIDRDITLFERLYTLVNWFLCWWKGVYAYFPVYIPDFITSFREQSNFVNEANNLIKMRETYKDNPYLVFPNPICISSNILIMEYVDGEVFQDTDDISVYAKTKLFMIFYLYTRTMTLVHNFNHGDLHMSNWKIRKADTSLGYEIIIYDFGFCWSMPESRKCLITNAVDLFESMNNNVNDRDISLFADIMYESIHHDTIPDKQSVRDDILDYIHESPYIGNCEGKVSITPTIIYRLVHDYCETRHIFMTSELLQFIIMYTQLHILCAQYGLTNLYGLSEHANSVYKDRYIDTLNMCKTYDIYPEYVEYIHHKLREMKPVRKSVFECSTSQNYEEFRSLALSFTQASC